MQRETFAFHHQILWILQKKRKKFFEKNLLCHIKFPNTFLAIKKFSRHHKVISNYRTIKMRNTVEEKCMNTSIKYNIKLPFSYGIYIFVSDALDYRKRFS